MNSWGESSALMQPVLRMDLAVATIEVFLCTRRMLGLVPISHKLTLTYLSNVEQDIWKQCCSLTGYVVVRSSTLCRCLVALHIMYLKRSGLSPGTFSLTDSGDDDHKWRR